jgi:tetratricopeptide (TPR) repeat protein
VGTERYRKAMARLFKSQKAYAAFDSAEQAFKKGDARQALQLTQQAIRLEPREAHFHSLLGDIALSQKNLTSAKSSYDKAISLNDQFYYYYLQRGKIYEAQRNTRAAQADYAASVKLLPTSKAQLSLGQFAELAGKEQVAKRYYAMAAQARGEDADKAKAALMRLDPPPTLETRLLVRQGVNRQGNFVIELINQTSRSVRNIQLGVQLSAGAPQRVQLVRQVIPAGQRRVIDTGQRLSRQRASQIKVVVLKADVVR